MAVEAAPDQQRISIEPLDPRRHDRTLFSCGAARLDNFLKRTARKHHARDFSRVWVATDGRSPRIPGFYALNAHSLEGGDLIEDGGSELTKKRRAFYAGMGFQSLPDRPLRMFISIDTVRTAAGGSPGDDRGGYRDK